VLNGVLVTKACPEVVDEENFLQSWQVAANIQYYFEYKASSNLRHIQILNVGLGEKLERCTFPNLRCTSIFHWEELRKMCIAYLK
jgi:hypothetical protein